MFKHFLVTQFNLLQFPLGVEGEDNWVDWTRRRIKLFETYCLPSLLNQSNKNFTWLIYFDKQTPDEFKPLIDELCRNHTFIQPRFADGNDEFEKKYLRDIKTLADGAEWLLISRTDNDDCLHKDAIQTIQDNFKQQDNFLISLTSGYTFNVVTKELSHYFYPMSPFITIIEDNSKDNIQGVFCKSHTYWNELRLFMYKELLGLNKKSRFVLNKPLWMQIVHGENVSNSAKRGMPVLKSRNLGDYGIELKTKNQPIMNIKAYYNYVHWKRYFKSWIVKLLQIKF